MAQPLVELAKSPLQTMVRRLVARSRFQQSERLQVESLGLTEISTQELDLQILRVVLPQGSQNRPGIRGALLLEERFNQQEGQGGLGKSSDALGQGLVTGQQLGDHGSPIPPAPAQFSQLQMKLQRLGTGVDKLLETRFGLRKAPVQEMGSGLLQ
jgi:hypothetical protein